MRDTIYRDEAIKAIKDHSFALGDDYMEINGYGAIDDIRALPSADRPSGEWIDNGDRYFRCSLCGTKDTDRWCWCHGCGARMKGADDD